MKSTGTVRATAPRVTLGSSFVSAEIGYFRSSEVGKGSADFGFRSRGFRSVLNPRVKKGDPEGVER